MAGQQKQGGKSKAGRKRSTQSGCVPTKVRYDREDRRFRNKLARVRKYNGEVAAERYQREYPGRMMRA
jgi:ribosomal protein L19E